MPDWQVMNCPSCRTPMQRRSFERKIRGTVELELCFSCQGIWFDKYENLQIQPHGVIQLFKLIHEHSGDQRLPLAARLACPRCGERMVHSMDRVKSGAFNYLHCVHDHGHFIVFAQFMIEKGFVRQLNRTEIEKIKAKIGIVRCSGCGAPIDIRKDSACPYCYAPIALLDPQAVESALASYQTAADRKPAPTDPMLLADVIINKQREFSAHPRSEEMHRDFGDFLIDRVAAAWRAQ